MIRRTKEGYVEIRQNGNEIRVDTGDKALDHLLTTLLFYMQKSASIKARYDLKHHLWEEVGIALGRWLKPASDDIKRFGYAIVPMDDSLVVVAVDVSRTYLVLEMSNKDVLQEEDFNLALVEEFLKAFARELQATISIKVLTGKNIHHIIEATFKGLGMALLTALEESKKIRSTKGALR